MPHNALIRADLAAWGTGTTIANTEMWALDEAQFQSVNGDLGGVWAPADPIEIGGSGLTLSATGNVVTGAAALLAFVAGADCNIGDGASASILSVEFNSLQNFNSGATLNLLNGSICDISSGVVVNVATSNWTWTGNSAFAGGADVTFGDGASGSTFTVANLSDIHVANGGLTYWTAGATLHCDGTAYLDGTTELRGTNMLTTPLVCSALGRVQRRVVWLADANVSKTIADGDLFVMKNGVMSVGRTLTLDVTGGAEGDTIRVANFDSVKTLTVGGPLPAPFGLVNVAESSCWVDYIWDAVSGNWRVLANGQVPTP